jgi:hypothetical protein
VVENRDDDATARQRLGDLDLAIASIQPAVQLEDLPRLRRAADRDSRALTQCIVSSPNVPAAPSMRPRKNVGTCDAVSEVAAGSGCAPPQSSCGPSASQPRSAAESLGASPDAAQPHGQQQKPSTEPRARRLAPKRPHMPCARRFAFAALNAEYWPHDPCSDRRLERIGSVVRPGRLGSCEIVGG